LAGLCLLALAACAGDAPVVLAPLLDAGAAWGRSPALLESSELRSWSSAERQPYSFPAFPHGNKDFNNFIAVCGSRPALPLEHCAAPGSCDPALGGQLIARDDSGPGCDLACLLHGRP
jgi:hypothetical protein